MKQPRHVLIICFALISVIFAQRPAGGSAQTTQPAATQSTSGPQPGAAFVRENYSKYEYRIPMRDGVKLFTSVYVPKDAITEGRTYPILMQRTPYNVAPYGVDKYRATLGPSELFAREKFIFVYQDVRGRFMSEGDFTIIRPHKPAKGPKDTDESTDCYDTVEWLIKNVTGNTGKVGMWGVSQPGFFAAAGMIDAHPALVAVSPQAPVTDYYMGDDSYHNGAFMLAHRKRFAATRPDVLVYRTEPLDHDVTVFGPISVDLKVSTTGTDSDFDVKLIDVYAGDYPDFNNPPPAAPGAPPTAPVISQMGGYQQLIRGEPFRGKYRKSFEKPVPFEPGKPDRIRFKLPDVAHTFRAGHRIMIHVQSSWFPLTDRNPQKFMEIPKAQPADFVKATQRVYVGGVDGSRIEFLTAQ